MVGNLHYSLKHDSGKRFYSAIASLSLILIQFAFGNVTISSMDESGAEPQWSKPRIFIKNDGIEALQLFKLRYYFMVEVGKSPAIEVWDPSSVSSSITVDPVGNAFVEFNLGGASLNPGESFHWGNGLLFGLRNSDWSPIDKSNDWSAVATNLGTVINPRITLLDNLGNILMGNGPQMSSEGHSSSSSYQITSPIKECYGKYAMLAENEIIIRDRVRIKNGPIQSN